LRKLIIQKFTKAFFLNLLTNAIKYRSPKRAPQIIFKSYIDEDGMITLTCQDNGIGIDLDKHGAKLWAK
jgi:signal transduction histidine kinase